MSVITSTPKKIEIVTREGKVFVDATYVGKFWGTHKDYWRPGRFGKSYTVTHLATGQAFCTEYATAKLAKAAAKGLDGLLPYTTMAEMDGPQRTLRLEVRALWSLASIRSYGEAYQATSKLYRNV